MIVDASALLAIVFDETDAAHFATALKRIPVLRISSVNWLEAAIRVDSTGDLRFLTLLETVVRQSGLAIVPATEAHAAIARAAYRRFGKGNHPARLNFADCFAYALAKETGEPLLFKGGDFSLTDITPA